jgi:arylsulfatase A-like enzyme
MKQIKIPVPWLLLVGLLFTFLLSGCTVKEEADSPPNILFILADDLGYGDPGCYGQEIIETPNIDGLAREGMLFTQFYSGSPVCAPARCVLLTGRHSGHAFIRGNDEWGERGDVWDYAKAVQNPGLEGQRPIPDSIYTVAEMLQTTGYKTACIGKWGLGGPGSEGVPNRQGFDFFFGYNCQRQAHTYFPKHLWRNEEKVWLDNELVAPGTKLDENADPADPASYRKYNLNQYAPELMLDEALSFLVNNKDQPFFLYYASPIPHVALQAPEDFVEKYIRKIGPEEPYLGDLGYFPNRTPRATYAAMVDYLDFQIGEIIQKLKELGLYENTVIFFTSDNGPTYNGGSDSPYFDSAGPFRSDREWAKGFLHEGGIRVPLIVTWPGKVQPGTRSDRIGAFYDLLPTLCEIVNEDVPEYSDGISFLSTLLGKDESREHDFLYWEFPENNGQQAVRMGKWKGIRENIDQGNLVIQLFDLENDIREEHDVSADHPEVITQIRAIMEAQHRPAEIERFRMEALGDQGASGK